MFQTIAEYKNVQYVHLHLANHLSARYLSELTTKFSEGTTVGCFGSLFNSVVSDSHDESVNTDKLFSRLLYILFFFIFY